MDAHRSTDSNSRIAAVVSDSIDGGQPRASFRHFVRRVWRSRARIPPMLRVSAVWGTPLIVIVGGLFLWTALNSGTGHAFDIVTGTASPLTLHGGAAGVALAVVGYLLIPAFVGILVASVLTARAERVLRPRNEVEDEIVQKVLARLAPEFTAPPGSQAALPPSQGATT